jgi:hypothetical protein
MKVVSKKEFWKYFENKEYATKQGDWFHSDIFIVDGEEVGYRETSSWGANDVYKLKYGSANTEAINLIGHIIWQKENLSK